MKQALPLGLSEVKGAKLSPGSLEFYPPELFITQSLSPAP